jgi:hypothetical protein
MNFLPVKVFAHALRGTGVWPAGAEGAAAGFGFPESEEIESLKVI